MNSADNQKEPVVFLGLTIRDKKTPYKLFGAIVVLWILCWGILSLAFGDLGKQGQFGDMFGSVNALFSGLAFAGLILTILLQMEELREQREELKLTRETLKDQKREFEKQNETLSVQRFESTFFNLLGVYNEILKSMTMHVANVNLSGRECFRHIFDTQFRSAISSVTDPRPLTLEVILQQYNRVYDNRQGDLGHYFRTLYNIVRFVHEERSLPNRQSKMVYIRFIRAQLSSYELALLLYNGLTRKGEKFKPLIEEYRLLKNYDSRQVIQEGDEKAYKAIAFGRSVI